MTDHELKQRLLQIAEQAEVIELELLTKPQNNTKSRRFVSVRDRIAAKQAAHVRGMAVNLIGEI